MNMPRIDPLLSLALSMQSNPGVYALLLGSGVSRAASIPTGWEVVLDLIHKLATAEGEDVGGDPEAWFTQKYGIAPTYSGLLDVVAKSQAERSSLLKGYFEPREEDAEQGLKVPTKAHFAIASLCKQGVVKLILTTNFDRLMEQALASQGINPTVIRTPSDIEGAMPLVHSNCAVVKLHGDYHDLRTKNTPVELDTYDARMDGLLDRVLDEFGLVVCGWSGEWDTALQDAICRAKGRRFTTYWTQFGEPGDGAKRVIQNRAAEVIAISSADDFFDTLAQKVATISEMNSPHPLSPKLAVAQAKKYLSSPEHRIRLHDLLMDAIEDLAGKTDPEAMPVSGSVNAEIVSQRVQEMESLSEVAVAVIATGTFWGTIDHLPIWLRAIDRLANGPKLMGGKTTLLGLRYYPCVLLQYAAGIGAAAAGNMEVLHGLLIKPGIRTDRSEGLLSLDLFRELGPGAFRVFDPPERKLHVPRTVRIQTALHEPLRTLIPSEDQYTMAFDTFETLQSMEAADRGGWAMPGAFMYRYYAMRGSQRTSRRDGSPLLAMHEDVERNGGASEVLAAGFLQGSQECWKKALQKVDEMSASFH